MQEVARFAAALFVLVGAAVHYELWRTGPGGIDHIGPLFIANVVVSGVLVVAILLRADVRITLAAFALSMASLVAPVLSPTTGLPGFTEGAWTDMALRAATAEIGAIVALRPVLAFRRRPQLAMVSVRVRSRDWRAR